MSETTKKENSMQTVATTAKRLVFVGSCRIRYRYRVVGDALRILWQAVRGYAIGGAVPMERAYPGAELEP